MSAVLVVSPHPDDETLGCGGVLLNQRAAGAEVHWLIVTAMTAEAGFDPEQIAERSREIAQVAEAYGFASVVELGHSAASLDAVPAARLVEQIGAVIKDIQAEIVYLPFGGDAHSDHRVVFEAAAACTKWFRYPSVRRVLCYETISETDAALTGQAFTPNVFVDISDYLEEKLRIVALFKSEIHDFPFPRSLEAIAALAALRGTQSGSAAAEAFMLLKSRE